MQLNAQHFEHKKGENLIGTPQMLVFHLPLPVTKNLSYRFAIETKVTLSGL